jgi:hypothetical protein
LEDPGISLKDNCKIGMVWTIDGFFDIQGTLILVGGFLIFFAIMIKVGQAI